MKQFAIRYHNMFKAMFFASLVLLASTFVMACSGTIFADAPAVIQTIIATFSALTAAFAFVPGLGAEAQTVLGLLNAGLAEAQEIETLIEQYKTTPNETLLQKIESALQEGISNTNALLQPVGVPAAFAQKVQALAQVILNQFEAWVSQIQALKPATPQPTAATTTVGTAHALVAHTVTTHTVSKPLSSHDLKSKVQAILAAPTGDATVDAAFSKVSV